jgi:hypothetical protein
MPFLAERHVEIPNKDILSWTFDEQRFDIDKPVSFSPDSLQVVSSLETKPLTWLAPRFILMRPIPHDPSLLDRQR